MKRFHIHGYALVCRNDCIADAAGKMPEALHNEADWAYFQAELETAQALILGRLAHEATPNTTKRLRIIMSRGVSGLSRRDDGWWWNPADLNYEAMLEAVVPQGGKIAVPGGQGPFDYFLKHGFDGFHLSRTEKLAIEAGVKVFSGCDDNASAEELLRQAGLFPEPEIILDPEAGVGLRVWRAPTPNL